MPARTLRIAYVDVAETNGVPDLPIRTPADAARVLRRHFASEPVEVFGVLCLDTVHVPIAYHEVSRGTLDMTLVHPREVFKPAILTNAAAIIVAHNHPSGRSAPSGPDHTITRRLIDAATVLGIPVLDHLIIAGEEEFYSFHIAGEFLSPSPSGGSYDNQDYLLRHGTTARQTG